MPKPVTVTVSTKVITATGLSAEDAETFTHMVPSDKLEVVRTTHNGIELLPKEAKELAAFCEFARRPEFLPTIRRLMRSEPVLRLPKSVMIFAFAGVAFYEAKKDRMIVRDCSLPWS